jgi:regulatory protein
LSSAFIFWLKLSAFLYFAGFSGMSKITGIKRGKRGARKVDLFLDGKPALELLPETARKQNLKLGQELAGEVLENLARADLNQRCYNTAARFLSYRPRSESEIKQRLARHGYDAQTIEKTIERYREMGLVDDAAFARFWIENRNTFSPRSRRLAKMELKKKGLQPGIIEEAINDIDEAENAYRAALSRARRLAALDYKDFRVKLGQYLGRRGFSYGIIKEITGRIWKELRKK